MMRGSSLCQPVKKEYNRFTRWKDNMRNKMAVILVCSLLLANCGRGTAVVPASRTPDHPETTFQALIPTPTPASKASPTPLPPLDLPTELLIQTQPKPCMSIGDTAYDEPPVDTAGYSRSARAAIVLDRGVTILVTNDSDEVNGETAGVNELMQNPGPDGISLREALLVTNNEPGEYTIRFGKNLKGATIQVGSWDQNELPPLEGGSVILNGDIDGDDQADVILRNSPDQPGERGVNFGIRIHSSHNTLYALKLVDFTNAILFDAPFKDRVIAENILSRLVIQGGNGIAGGSGSEQEAHNTWSNTWIIGNTFHARGGISFGLVGSSDGLIENLVIEDNQIMINAENESDVYDGVILTSGGGARSTGNEVREVYIANNTIQGNQNSGISLLSGYGGAGLNSIHHVYIVGNRVEMQRQEILSTFGLAISAGYWVNQEGNDISDILVAGNSFTGFQENAFHIAAGAVGSRGNRVERLRISNNHIQVTRPVRDNGAQTLAISLVTGDGATDYADPSLQPVVYPDDNTLQDVWISHNTIEGQGGQAVAIDTGDPGAQRNRLSNIYIMGNDMKGFYPASGFMISAISLYLAGIDADRISNVFIQQNTIQQANLRQQFGGEEFISGAIILAAGDGAEQNRIDDVWITYNEIQSPAPSISIIGGFSRPDKKVTLGNQIKSVRLWCNEISEAPVLLQVQFPEVKGINLVGGYGLAKNNTVTDILLAGNVVAGVENDISIFQDVGAGSEANRVEYPLRISE